MFDVQVEIDNTSPSPSKLDRPDTINQQIHKTMLNEVIDLLRAKQVFFSSVSAALNATTYEARKELNQASAELRRAVDEATQNFELQLANRQSAMANQTLDKP